MKTARPQKKKDLIDQKPFSENELMKSIGDKIDHTYDTAYNQGYNHAIDLACEIVSQYPLMVERIKFYKK